MKKIIGYGTGAACLALGAYDLFQVARPGDEETPRDQVLNLCLGGAMMLLGVACIVATAVPGDNGGRGDGGFDDLPEVPDDPSGVEIGTEGADDLAAVEGAETETPPSVSVPDTVAEMLGVSADA